MHAVGDGADRHLLRRDGRPQLLEHLRLVWPWSLATPLDLSGQPQAHHGHVERGIWPALPGKWPRAMRCRWRRRTRPPSAEKYLSISSRGNRSMPAGTGVWVVNMVPARAASIASAQRKALRA